jgi:beta-lactamase class A
VLLNGIGGPTAFNQFMRTIATRSRGSIAASPRSTPTCRAIRETPPRPRAMVDNMLRIFTQDVLSLPSRALLIDWMVASRTGLDRVRAGLPRSWNPGDKTGTGENGASTTSSSPIHRDDDRFSPRST